MDFDLNLENRIDRWKKLYYPNPEKKTILFIINYPDAATNRPTLNAENKKNRIDWAKKQYEWQIKNSESYCDDSLPHLFPLTGTEIFAQAFGCRVIYPEDSMPFALPMISSSSEVAKLKIPKLEDSPLMVLFEIADELRRFAGDDALMRLPDIQCPMDISALIWDKNDFFPSMIDTPEAILELSGKVSELLIYFLDEWFRRYGTKYIAHFPDYYMERGITMSTDEIGCVSPKMFCDFFAGEINELSRRYGGVGIHCCAESIKQWDNLKQIEGLKLLNIHLDWEQIKKAQEIFNDVCVMMSYVSQRDDRTSNRNITLDEIDNVFPEKCRLVLPLSANNIEHAKELADIYSKYR